MDKVSRELKIQQSGFQVTAKSTTSSVMDVPVSKIFHFSANSVNNEI